MVSVIVPNYNHSNFLQQRIGSILCQTCQDFELIILDDCSTDNSRNIIELYKNDVHISHIVFNETNSGSPFLQWRKGIDLAKGEYIWIAESDDWAENTFLEELIVPLDSDKQIAIAYCQTYDITENGDIRESRLNWTNDFEKNIWENDFCLKGQKLLPFLYKKNVIPNVSACLMKTEYFSKALNAVNNLEKYKMCGDWLIWLMLAEVEDTKILFLNKHLNYFRFSDQSTRNQNTQKKKITRLLEEATIFNSGIFSIEGKVMEEKNRNLKERWFSTFSYRKWSFSFFDICVPIRSNKLSFLISFIKKKWGI